VKTVPPVFPSFLSLLFHSREFARCSLPLVAPLSLVRAHALCLRASPAHARTTPLSQRERVTANRPPFFPNNNYGGSVGRRVHALEGGRAPAVRLAVLAEPDVAQPVLPVSLGGVDGARECVRVCAREPREGGAGHQAEGWRHLRPPPAPATGGGWNWAMPPASGPAGPRARAAAPAALPEAGLRARRGRERERENRTNSHRPPCRCRSLNLAPSLEMMITDPFIVKVLQPSVSLRYGLEISCLLGVLVIGKLWLRIKIGREEKRLGISAERERSPENEKE